MKASRLSLLTPLVLIAAMASVPSVIADGSEPELASVILMVDPQPPFCVENPGGTLEINWEILHETTPNYVIYELWEPDFAGLVETETYPGDTGIMVTRFWTAPAALADGKYWVRVEYYSFEAGNEANSEVAFYLCNATGSICAEKWSDEDCDGELSGGDVPVLDWWICVHTPFGDDFCKQTDAAGLACWNGLMFGDYTVFEFMQPGWIPIYPESYDVTLTEMEPAAFFQFLNREEDLPSPAEPSTWGKIKAIYR